MKLPKRSLQRKKKPVEFHFVDMNDPERYKKLKVARACDFCRRRKSKCDIGIPGSGTCSNCQKHQMVCIFSPVTTTPRGGLLTPTAITTTVMTPQQYTTFEQFLFRFPLLQIKDGQVGYEKSPPVAAANTNTNTTLLTTTHKGKEPPMSMELSLFKLYFKHIHLAYPLLLKQSIMNIQSQDRLLLSKSLRYSVMALGCKYDSTMKESAHYFYEIAKSNIATWTTPRLDTVQTLLLLYKYDETYQMEGEGLFYLERAQDMIGQLTTIIPQQQEMINRARWILFSCVGLSNLSSAKFNHLYKHVELPVELPQALKQEIEHNVDAFQHVNRFAQIANLSVLYSHTVSSMITGGSKCHLICIKQFKEIRQHWHDSLHPITQSKLVSLCEEEIDIMILYSAVLYDMLYLLLLSHYHLEWDGIETAYRLQRMIHTWVSSRNFTSAVQSRRMACFALMLCLQIHVSRHDDKIEHEFIQQIQQSMKYIQFVDTRIEHELNELYNMLHCGVLQQDYFSLIIPPQHMDSTTNNSSPAIDNPAITPGLWSITTNGGGLTTPIREEEYHNTSEWMMDQLQPTTSFNNTATTTTTTTTTMTPFHDSQDYFFLNPGHWSPPIDQLSTSTNYLKLYNSSSDQDSNSTTTTFKLNPLPSPSIIQP